MSSVISICPRRNRNLLPTSKICSPSPNVLHEHFWKLVNYLNTIVLLCPSSYCDSCYTVRSSCQNLVSLSHRFPRSLSFASLAYNRSITYATLENKGSSKIVLVVTPCATRGYASTYFSFALDSAAVSCYTCCRTIERSERTPGGTNGDEWKLELRRTTAYPKSIDYKGQEVYNAGDKR